MKKMEYVCKQCKNDHVEELILISKRKSPIFVFYIRFLSSIRMKNGDKVESHILWKHFKSG